MKTSPRAACFSLRGHPAIETYAHPRRIGESRLRIGFACTAVSAMILAGSPATAATQDGVAPPKRQTMPAPPPPPTATDEQARLEKIFVKAMTDIVLKGSWRMTGKDGVLTEPRDEQYRIISVSKGFADHWVISARMQFGNNDVTMPFPVRVVWAGDTPIITVDDFAVPGVGTYSARVMIYRDYYCGSWFGKGYSGILSGRIVPASEIKDKKEPPPADEATAKDETKADDQTEPRP